MDKVQKPISSQHGQVQRTSCHEGLKGELKYNSTVALTSVLDGSGQRHAPAALPPGKERRCALLRMLGGPVWTDAESLIAPGFNPRTVQPAASNSVTVLKERRGGVGVGAQTERHEH